MSEPPRPLTLRMPADLFEQLRASAQAHDRSAGGEVRHIIREYFDRGAQTGPRRRSALDDPRPRPVSGSAPEARATGRR